jgi:hypothetical protein
MAAKKQVRRAPVRRKKQRRWIIPKLLLLLGYSAVLVVLGSIFFMKAELRRFGVLGGENTVEKSTPEQTQQTTMNKRKPETTTATAASNAGEITVEEKKQLEDILRSRNSE